MPQGCPSSTQAASPGGRRRRRKTCCRRSPGSGSEKGPAAALCLPRTSSSLSVKELRLLAASGIGGRILVQLNTVRLGICLLDRKFCSFYNLTKLRQRRIGVVTPLHRWRDPQKLIRHGRPLGKNQWLVPLHLQPHTRKRYDDPSLPKVLFVRLIRVAFRRGTKIKVLWLVTTLMDPVEYPAREVAQLY